MGRLTSLVYSSFKKSWEVVRLLSPFLDKRTGPERPSVQFKVIQSKMLDRVKGDAPHRRFPGSPTPVSHVRALALCSSLAPWNRIKVLPARLLEASQCDPTWGSWPPWRVMRMEDEWDGVC